MDEFDRQLDEIQKDAGLRTLLRRMYDQRETPETLWLELQQNEVDCYEAYKKHRVAYENTKRLRKMFEMSLLHGVDATKGRDKKNTNVDEFLDGISRDLPLSRKETVATSLVNERIGDPPSGRVRHERDDHPSGPPSSRVRHKRDDHPSGPPSSRVRHERDDHPSGPPSSRVRHDRYDHPSGPPSSRVRHDRDDHRGDYPNRDDTIMYHCSICKKRIPPIDSICLDRVNRVCFDCNICMNCGIGEKIVNPNKNKTRDRDPHFYSKMVCNSCSRIKKCPSCNMQTDSHGVITYSDDFGMAIMDNNKCEQCSPVSMKCLICNGKGSKHCLVYTKYNHLKYTFVRCDRCVCENCNEPMRPTLIWRYHKDGKNYFDNYFGHIYCPSCYKKN